MPPRTDLLRGRLDLLIHKTLDLEALHGRAISGKIHLPSRDALEVNQGRSIRRSTGCGTVASSIRSSARARRAGR